MTIFDEVMHTFFTTWISRNATCLAQLAKAPAPTRNNFVNVGLMSCVPQDGVTRLIKYAVQCKCEFDCTQVGTEMATRFGNCSHYKITDLGSQLLEFGSGQTSQIAGLADYFKNHGLLRYLTNPPR